MTRLSVVVVCQRAAATMVLSRPLGVGESGFVPRTRARGLCWYHGPWEQDILWPMPRMLFYPFLGTFSTVAWCHSRE